MAWDKIHRSVNSDGGVSMTPGYYSETITLGNDADASTSVLDTPIKSDTTILVKFSADITADTYVQVEHSWDGTTWIKEGNFEEDNSVDHDDLSKDMSKISALDNLTPPRIDTSSSYKLYNVPSDLTSPVAAFKTFPA